MVAKTSILKELETIYEKSGNQLYVLYGRTNFLTGSKVEMRQNLWL